MKLKYLLFLPIFFLFSCSTLTSNPKIIALSEIEKFKPGKTNSNYILSTLGKPNIEIRKFELNIIWEYNELNLTFTLDNNETLVGLSWVPSGQNISVQELIQRYKSSDFKQTIEGWDRQGHFYSNDVRYTDDKNGISFFVNSQNQSVMYVTFYETKKKI